MKKEGFVEPPEKQQVSMMIDGMNHKPAPKYFYNVGPPSYKLVYKPQ